MIKAKPNRPPEQMSDVYGDLLIQVHRQRKQIDRMNRVVGWIIPIAVAVGFLIGKLF
jgi:hypothetical protein